MTQRTYLTSTVLTVASGQPFCQPDLAFGLVQALTGRTVIPSEELGAVLAEAAADLRGQFDWIAGLEIPDLSDTPDPRGTRWTFLADVSSEHGGTQTVRTRAPLAEIPLVTFPVAASLVRWGRR